MKIKNRIHSLAPFTILSVTALEPPLRAAGFSLRAGATGGLSASVAGGQEARKSGGEAPEKTAWALRSGHPKPFRLPKITQAGYAAACQV